MRSWGYRTLVHSVLLVAGVLTAGCVTWEQRTPSPHPPAGNGHIMAHVGNGKVLLFVNSNVSNDTWLYDVASDTWTNQQPSGAPSIRTEAAMAWAGGDKVLLFGGLTSANEAQDTWIYDLSENTWTQEQITNPPTQRRAHAMAYLGNRRVLMHGGVSPGSLPDTWIATIEVLAEGSYAVLWARVAEDQDGTLGARSSHDMAYVGDGKVVMFGGTTSGAPDTTWVFDGGSLTWSEVASQPNPGSRTWHRIVASGAGQAILFGGRIDATTDAGDTWRFFVAGGFWDNLSPSAAPSARSLQGLAPSRMDGKGPLVLFGGTNGTDETWLYGPNADGTGGGW